MNEPREHAIRIPLGELRECSCGALVSIDGGGRKFDYETGRVHLHLVEGQRG